MKRILLITTILVLCVFVIIFGNLIFVRSNSVLKYQRNSIDNSNINNVSLSIKSEENKMDSVNAKKHNPVLSGNSELSSPLGYEDYSKGKAESTHYDKQGNTSKSDKNLYQIIRRLKDMMLTKGYK
ncbi:hypothetical protein Q428_13765 [Fervidicella metallireducens AeB]|uniref:Uncharacterized protein n=1 Tax=Fervidicella metallireducens AeB TaxID=1403537 RepID=A0A017RRT1_9CLOT|nr:hypothetical protein [Fervidicella metallireducens]EYE87357.1 hypothetical protein Q428_13765 [Fervidicella metallireducens AeB]